MSRSKSPCAPHASPRSAWNVALVSGTLLVSVALLCPQSVHAQRRPDAAASARVATSPSSAPDPAPVDEGHEARTRYMRGVELYDAGEFDAALAEFRRSYDLENVPGVLVSVALALTGLNRFDEAIATYQRYLATATRASPARRREIEASVAALEERIATLTLEVSVSGAEVRIDGRTLGSSPLGAPLRVASGLRVLEILREGHVPVREEIELAGGQSRTLRVELAPIDRSAHLRLRVTPEAALLRIDGLEVGHGTSDRRVPVGGHVIEGVLENFRIYRAEISLAENQDLDLHLQLESAALGLESEPWFWAVLGVGLVGVAGAITAGVLCGTTDVCTQTVYAEGNTMPGRIDL